MSSTVTLRPTSDHYNDGSCSGSYADVDEATLNTSDKIYGTGGGSSTHHELIFNMADHGISPTTGLVVTNVRLCTAHASAGISTIVYQYVAGIVHISGTDYAGSEVLDNSTSTSYGTWDWTTNPATSAAWTWTEINDLVAGVYTQNGDNRLYVYQFYVIVTYDTLPTVETHAPATSITATHAHAEGHVTSDGGSTVSDRGICYSTSTNPTTASNHVHNGSGTGTFDTELTELSEGTTYHTRAFAINSAGIAYGDEVDFTTLSVVIDTSQYKWNARAVISNASVYKWNVRTAISTASQYIWNVLFKLIAENSSQLVWDVKQVASDILVLDYNIKVAIDKASQYIWHTRRAIAGTVQIVWYISKAISASVQSIWHTRKAISDSLQLIWYDLITVPGTMRVRLLWNARALAAGAIQLAWHTAQQITDTLQAVWNTWKALTDSLKLIWYTKIARATGLKVVAFISHHLFVNTSEPERQILSYVSNDLTIKSDVEEN